MIYPHEKKQPTGPTEPYPKKVKSLVSMMVNYLGERDLSFTCARENGWYPTNEIDDTPRMVIPADSLSGRRYWQARAMIPVPEKLRWRSARGAKNGAVVVCWPTYVGNKTKIVLVEGPLDALAAAGALQVGLAAMGKSNVSDVLYYLKTGSAYSLLFRDLPVIVVPDLDALEFGSRAVTELARTGIRAELRPPPYEDLAALTLLERHDLLS